MRICILGNSVGLRMRPHRRHDGQLTYCELLMREHEVFNSCRAGALITEQFRYLDDDVVAHFPDVTILNFGIVELFHRSTFRCVNNHPIRNYYNNSILGRNYRINPGLSDIFARAINAMLKRIGKILGIRWQWLDTLTYLEALRTICDLLLAETSSRIVILEMPRLIPGSSKYSPETAQRICDVNATVHAWASESGGRIAVLPVNALIFDNQHMERLVPDAIHFSALGHRIVYTALRKLITTWK